MILELKMARVESFKFEVGVGVLENMIQIFKIVVVKKEVKKDTSSKKKMNEKRKGMIL